MTDSANDNARRGLLPAGLQDLLPPYAAHEAAVVERLLACFAGYGYERVKPPLLEFEDGLLSGAGHALAQQTFRLMDPVSQRMMGLRADITPQVARIAATRLRSAPRPLRLCYGGQVLQVRGSQLRPERQFGQVGCELIGASGPVADAEVVRLAAAALEQAGVRGLSVDLNQPTLVGRLAAALGLAAQEIGPLREALDHKDAAAVAQLAGDKAMAFMGLLEAAGPADEALAAIAAMKLPPAVHGELGSLSQVVALLRQTAPALTLTVDPVEHRGFEYQSGISFILFAQGVRGELGRGGRYQVELDASVNESATGFTLFMDSLMRALPEPSRPGRVFLPAGACDLARGEELRAEGWVTLDDLTQSDKPDRAAQVAEARRLSCSHILIDSEVVALEGESDG